MNKNATLVENLSAEQIKDLFTGLQAQIRQLQQEFEPKIPTELLTRKEVAEIFKCDISTVHNWTKKGKLIPYGIGNRVYFKRSEIAKSLLCIKVGGTDEKK